jgi:hypothetical protein
VNLITGLIPQGKTKGAYKRAATIADMLCTCGETWKHGFSSRQEFVEKMRDAIRRCSRDP